MARRKKRGWLERFADISIVSLVFNPVTLMIGVSVLAIVLWNQYHAQLELSVNRAITRDVLHLSPPPEWIKTDISRVAIQDSRLSEIRLGEPHAVERVAASIAVQPWVKSVERVRKTTTGIHVEVLYRQPVAIVEIGKDQLVPVDDEGVVLDGRDFASGNLQEYWRVYLPRPITNGLATGRVWDDIRVTDSVLIANAWQGRQAEAGLFHIVNRSQPTRDRIRLDFYELWTKRGVIVIWGNPPGHEVAGEASAAEKIEAIRRFVQENGPLDAQSNRLFDVRTGRLLQSNTKLASDDVDFVNLTF